MTRWVCVLVLALAACSTTHGKGHTWGIKVTEEVNSLLADAELSAALYSTPETMTLISGGAVSPEIHALLAAYRETQDYEFTKFPQSPSFNEQDAHKREIVTYRAPRGSYLDIVVTKEKEGHRVLRLFKSTARDTHAQVIVLREYDRERDTWTQVDEGLVANTAGITRAWSAFEAALQRETTTVELPIWANRSPGSGRIPFTIFMPPWSLFPELD